MNYEIKNATWRDKIAKHLAELGLTPGDLIACTLTETELDAEFYAGYGSAEGAPFTAWTRDYVIFPVCYDRAEWVASVPRNPCDKPTEHVGGG